MDTPLSQMVPSLDGLEQYLQQRQPDATATEEGFVADYLRSAYHLDSAFIDRLQVAAVSRVWQDTDGYHEEEAEWLLPTDLVLFGYVEQDQSRFTASQALEAVANIRSSQS